MREHCGRMTETQSGSDNQGGDVDGGDVDEVADPLSLNDGASIVFTPDM